MQQNRCIYACAFAEQTEKVHFCRPFEVLLLFLFRLFFSVCLFPKQRRQDFSSPQTKKTIQACESVVKLDVRFQAKAEVWFLLCFVFLRRLCKGWHILSFRKSLFSIPFASNYWYLNANVGRGRHNANKRLRNHKNSKHLNQKSQEQNCQKWPILEVNFKHIRYKSIDGPNSIYRLQNHLHLLSCAKNGWKKRFSKVAQFGIYWNLSGK